MAYEIVITQEAVADLHSVSMTSSFKFLPDIFLSKWSKRNKIKSHLKKIEMAFYLLISVVTTKSSLSQINTIPKIIKILTSH